MSKRYAIGCGLFLMLFGGWGMLTGGDRHEVLVFGVNAGQNVLHIVSGGLVVIAGLSGARAAVFACLGLGGFYGLLAVLGFMQFRPAIETLHLNRAADYLHLAVAVAGLWLAGSERDR